MDYKYLEQEYKDDAIAAALYGRELEHFHYSLDAVNFTNMLKTLPFGPCQTPTLRDKCTCMLCYRSVLEMRLKETQDRAAQVAAIYDALIASITDLAAHDAAVARCKAKRDFLKAKELQA